LNKKKKKKKEKRKKKNLGRKPSTVEDKQLRRESELDFIFSRRVAVIKRRPGDAHNVGSEKYIPGH